MKIVLLNPPMDLERSLGKAKGIAKYTAMVPMGLAYIASVLRNRNKDVEMIDAYAENLTIAEIIGRILDMKADVIGVSCVTPSFPITCRITRELKRKKRELIIVTGGSHPTILPVDALSEETIDFVVRGEGEVTICELIDTLESRGDLNKINGISFRENGRIVHAPERSFLKDLDSLPFPAYDLLPVEFYKAPPHWAIQEPVFYLFATRGCPFHCTFCAAELIGKTRRLRSIKNVLSEIKFLVKNYNARQIMFQDTCFPFERKYAFDLCNEMIKSRLNKSVVWTTSTRVDLVDQELLDKMYESGCRVINFGLESGNQKVLDRARKGFKLEKVYKATEMARKAGIKNFATFMLGLPGDTLESCLDTINLAKKLDLDYAQFYMTVPYPGSAIYSEAIKEGKIKTKDWEKYITMVSMTGTEPTYVPDNMNASQLKLLQKKAYKEFYFRPKLVWRHLLNIKSFGDLKRYFDVAKVLISAL